MIELLCYSPGISYVFPRTGRGEGSGFPAWHKVRESEGPSLDRTSIMVTTATLITNHFCRTLVMIPNGPSSTQKVLMMLVCMVCTEDPELSAFPRERKMCFLHVVVSLHICSIELYVNLSAAVVMKIYKKFS